MSASEGNSLFCFPKSLNVSRDEVERNIEYDACDVTPSAYPHRPSLKNMPGHGGNRTYDLWNTRGPFIIYTWGWYRRETKNTVIYLFTQPRHWSK